MGIKAGDEIVNVVTGERLVFHRTSAETDGDHVLVEAFVAPGGHVAAAHVHPNQEERFGDRRLNDKGGGWGLHYTFDAENGCLR